MLLILLTAAVFLSGCRGAVTASFEEQQEPFYESSYKRYLDSRGYKPGITPLAENEITINVTNFESTDEQIQPTQNGIRTGEPGTVTWPFFAETAGFYNLEVRYIPESGTNTQIKRIVSLDGEVLHDGLMQTAFNRSFRDEKDRIEVKNRNEIRPRAVEVFSERSVFLTDSQKRSIEPYIFFLSEGEHRLTFESVKEPMTITGLRFTAAPVVPSYKDYIAGADTAPYTGGNLVFQAERTESGTLAIRKSLPAITVKNCQFDPALEPFHPYRIVFNTIGGDTWKYPGDSIEWDIDVPADGLYWISFKGRQSINRGVISFRCLRINGEIPFAEASMLDFSHSPSMTNYILGGEEPWLFRFKKGRNTLSMETVLGTFGAPYSEVSESLYILNDLYRRIIQITGTVPDRYIDYEISRKVPDYVTVLESEHKRLGKVMEDLNAITIEKGSTSTIVDRLFEQIGRIARRPDDVTLELSQFKTNISGLAGWMVMVAEMPLELDSFTLMASGGEPVPAQANIFRRIGNDIVRFFATFFTDSQAVDTDTEGAKKAIKVWFPSGGVVAGNNQAGGRDQAQILRSLIDERFIPEHNISVNLELVPVEVIMPSTLAGVGPDVVISLDQDRLMDFAVRNALVDMSALDGFETEKNRFFDSAIEGITFQDKTYGLPETQSFHVLFYRRDILDALGVSPPETWDDLRLLIPVLHRNNFDVYMPHPGPFSSIVVQKGGDYYLGTGKDYGIASGLFEEPAMRAFKEFTDFFSSYRLPVTMDFTNRFRTGEVPVGIAEYTEYCRLELFAPEIRGLWSIALLPGTVRADGTVDNRAVSRTSQTVILSAAEEHGLTEEAWTFVRWWLSTEIQTEYANATEAVLGTAARYATANREVLSRLPWSTADAARLLEQFSETKGIPPVPGNYMTTRMVDYTFNSVVAGKANPRETLFLNAKIIDTELTKKRTEFGLSIVTDNGGR